MAHVRCPECGGYVRRSVEACPASGYFLPGHRVLRVALPFFIVGLVLSVALFALAMVARPLMNLVSYVGEHDARVGHRVEKIIEAKQPKGAERQK